MLTWSPSLAGALCDVWPLVLVWSLCCACRAFGGFQNVVPANIKLNSSLSESVWLELVLNVWPGGFCSGALGLARGPLGAWMGGGVCVQGRAGVRARAGWRAPPTGRLGPHHQRPGISERSVRPIEENCANYS